MTNSSQKLQLRNSNKFHGSKIHLLDNGNFQFQTAPPDPQFRAGSSFPETLAAQRQLAWVLGGDYRNPRRFDTDLRRKFHPNESLFRSPDVLFKGGYSELKFAGDRVNREVLRLDIWLQDHGHKVRYDIVRHPATNRITPEGDLSWLKKSGISYKIWGFQFWRLGRGKGAEIPLTYSAERFLTRIK